MADAVRDPGFLMAIDIGLVGVGPWGRHILRDLVELGCRVHTVTRTEASGIAAVEAGAASASTRIEALPDVQGAVIATPTTVHHESIRALVPRRVPLFVEKPLCATVDQAREVERLAGERVFVMDKWRYHPGIRALAEIVRREELGPVESLQLTRIGFKSKPRDTGVLTYLAPHDLAIAMEILGHVPEPVAARVARVDGRLVLASALLGTSPWVALEVSEVSAVRRREVVLVCAQGTVRLADSYSEALEIHRFAADLEETEREPERRPISREMPLRLELAAFLDHLNGGPPPKSSCREGVEALAVIERLHQLANVPMVDASCPGLS